MQLAVLFLYMPVCLLQRCTVFVENKCFLTQTVVSLFFILYLIRKMDRLKEVVERECWRSAEAGDCGL